MSRFNLTKSIFRERCPERSSHDHFEDQTPGELRESAFRRGFQQGAFMIFEAMEAGMTVEELYQYYSHDVANWRFRHGEFAAPRDLVEHPPIPSVLIHDGFLDAAPVFIRCPACLHVAKKNIRWVKSSNEWGFRCTNRVNLRVCGASSDIHIRPLREATYLAEAAYSRLQDEKDIGNPASTSMTDRDHPPLAFLNRVRIKLLCSACEKSTVKTVGWLKKNDSLNCGCGASITFFPGELRYMIFEAEVAHEALQEEIDSLRL